MENNLAKLRATDASTTGSRCIIHIGMHKTGSTSIQRALDRFEDNRFLYARLAGTSNHSLAIYSAFSKTPERHHLHHTAGRDQTQVLRYNDRIFQELDRCIEKTRGRTLIISGEDIGSLSERDLRKLRDYFDARFSELVIAGYVRPPAGFLASSFQQRVKSGTLNLFDPLRMYRSYQASFGKFDQVFGRDRVRLWKFDPEKFSGGDVVRDFCRRLEIPLPHKKSVRLNESLSTRAVAMCYVYNKFGARAGMDLLGSTGGTALLRLLDGEKFRLSPDSVRPVLEHNRADIEWMEERLGQSLREELGEHRDTDIRAEEDLLRPNPDVVAKLLRMLGRSAPKGVEGRTPEEVAVLVDALLRKRRYLGLWNSISQAFFSAAKK